MNIYTTHNGLIYECFFIGFYVIFIYFLLWMLLFSHMNMSIILQLFLIGFFKHYISYYNGIHNYYCNHNLKKRNILIFIESLIEGIIFICLGSFLLLLFKTNRFILCLFIIGFFLHIFNDINKLHYYFCNYSFY